MERAGKVKFRNRSGEEAYFFVIGQSVVNGHVYILVTDKEEGDTDAMILRDDSLPDDTEALYSEVTDDAELAACMHAFSELLSEDDVELEIEGA